MEKGRGARRDVNATSELDRLRKEPSGADLDRAPHDVRRGEPESKRSTKERGARTKHVGHRFVKSGRALRKCRKYASKRPFRGGGQPVKVAEGQKSMQKSRHPRRGMPALKPKQERAPDPRALAILIRGGRPNGGAGARFRPRCGGRASDRRCRGGPGRSFRKCRIRPPLPCWSSPARPCGSLRVRAA